MATYYKYAERDASNQVNWSEITSNMVNSLKEVEAIRESKRKAINDATTELSTTLSEAPQGEHSGLNEFAMTYANNAQQMRLMQDQLLKSGQLKLRDYNIGRANLTEGTTQLFNLGKKYQAVYKEKMDRFENGDSGMQEQFQMAELEAFANFSNHEAYINPTNGQVSVGKLISETKSGKSITTMDRTPGSFITVQELNFSVAQKVDKYKLDNLDADIDRLATKYVETFGPNFSIDDVRQMPEFNKMKQEMINKQMALGSQSVGSMLSDYVGIAPNGEAYSYTRDPNKQDENTILLVADPNQPGSGRLVPDFNSEIGKKQYKEAEGFIGREIEKQLGRTETKTEPSTSSKNEAKERNQQIGVRDLWNDMYTEPTVEGKNKIANAILSSPYLSGGKNPVTDINFLEINTGTDAAPVMELVMEVEYLDPRKNRSGENAIRIGENPTIKDWAMNGVEIHGFDKESDFMGTLNKDSKWGGTMAGVTARRGGNKQSNSTIVRNQVKQFFGNSKKDFVKADEDVVMTKLQGALSSLGFTFDTSYGVGADRVKVIAPDKKTFDFVVGSSTDNSEDLLKWLLPKITNEAADVFLESGLDISGGTKAEAEAEAKAKAENKKEDDKKKLPGT